MTSLSICPRRRVCTKSDNIEWLEGIPDHWGIVPSKVLFSVSNERAHPGDEHLSATQAYGVIPLSEYERIVGRQITKTLRHEEKRRHVEPDDFVISMRSFQGGLERVWVPGSVRSSYVVLRPSSRVHVPFFAHLLKSEKYIQALRATSNFIRDGQDLNINNFKLVDLPLVPLPEQKAIANFLDRKTAAIDALIEKKEKLLELLAEKRSALINKAVTKGLNPNVPMKDSGIPWIGEIPEHWTTSAISHYAEVFNGSTPTRSDPTHWEGDIPWLSSGKVNEWLVKEPTAWISDKAKRSAGLRLAPVGSIIIGMVGQGKTRGMSARLGIAACINQNMAAIVTARDLAAEFLHYCLIQSYKPNREYGRGGQQDALNCELVRSLRIPLPPKSEQLEIVAFLEDEIHRAAAVAEKATSQIERLREYRQSLITAAVTGQLEIPAEDYEATPTEDRPS